MRHSQRLVVVWKLCIASARFEKNPCRHASRNLRRVCGSTPRPLGRSSESATRVGVLSWVVRAAGQQQFKNRESPAPPVRSTSESLQPSNVAAIASDSAVADLEKIHGNPNESAATAPRALDSQLTRNREIMLRQLKNPAAQVSVAEPSIPHNRVRAVCRER